MCRQATLQRGIILKQEDFAAGPKGHIVDDHGRNANKV